MSIISIIEKFGNSTHDNININNINNIAKKESSLIMNKLFEEYNADADKGGIFVNKYHNYDIMHHNNPSLLSILTFFTGSVCIIYNIRKNNRTHIGIDNELSQEIKHKNNDMLLSSSSESLSSLDYIDENIGFSANNSISRPIIHECITGKIVNDFLKTLHII